MNQFGKICGHHWKERLKISKIAKFESDVPYANKDMAPQRCEIQLTDVFMMGGGASLCTGGSRGGPVPPYVSTKMRLEGPKIILLETTPLLSQHLDDLPPPPLPPLYEVLDPPMLCPEYTNVCNILRLWGAISLLVFNNSLSNRERVEDIRAASQALQA